MLRFHGKTKDGYRFTLSGILLTRENNLEGSYELKTAISVCSKKDRFERKKGRDLSESRITNTSKGVRRTIVKGRFLEDCPFERQGKAFHRIAKSLESKTKAQIFKKYKL